MTTGEVRKRYIEVLPLRASSDSRRGAEYALRLVTPRHAISISFHSAYDDVEARADSVAMVLAAIIEDGQVPWSSEP